MSLSFEEKFFSWLQSQGVACKNLNYQRPEAFGNVNAYWFSSDFPKNDLIIFVHGAGNDSLFPHVQLFKNFLKNGFDVFTFDLDGHGRKSSTLFDSSAVWSSVLTATSAILNSATYSNIHYIGHSLGGSVILQCLSRLNCFKERIKSLILLSVPMIFEPSGRVLLPELLTLFQVDLLRNLSNYNIAELLPSFGSFKRDLYPFRWKKPVRSEGQFGYLYELSRFFSIIANQEKDILSPAPVRMFYGSWDKIAPDSQGLALSQKIKPSSLVILPRETHFSLLFSRRTQQEICDFLRRKNETEN